jgi:hypothetical protein
LLRPDEANTFKTLTSENDLQSQNWCNESECKTDDRRGNVEYRMTGKDEKF